jgi:hypothetical protein
VKSYLIADTTKVERIEIIKSWMPVEDGLEDCEVDIFEMYRDYIDGRKEIVECNAAFQAGYLMEEQ